MNKEKACLYFCCLATGMWCICLAVIVGIEVPSLVIKFSYAFFGFLRESANDFITLLRFLLDLLP
jgi:hypothetical protein